MALESTKKGGVCLEMISNSVNRQERGVKFSNFCNIIKNRVLYFERLKIFQNHQQ